MKNQKNQPLISVIMPVYNAEGFLVEAIESILNQTYKNFEFIIVDDHSTDKSWEIIQKYQKRYPKKIRALRLKRTLNRGGDACCNLGLSKTKGKYIARMDADDVAHPKRLETQVNFLEKHKDIFLVGTNAYVIDKKSQIIGEKKVPLENNEIYQSYFTYHPIIHPSTMYRKIVNKKKFFYPKKFSANNDYYIFFKMICQGYKFTNLKEKLLYYRIHENNDTFNNIKQKFINTLKTRMIMVFKYNYQPALKQWLTTIIQALIILLLPSKLTKKIYLISKGIIRIANPFKKIYFIKNIKLSLKTA